MNLGIAGMAVDKPEPTVKIYLPHNRREPLPPDALVPDPRRNGDGHE
jgi:hypothetical protein